MTDSEVEFSMYNGSTNYDENSNSSWDDDPVEVPTNWRGWKNFAIDKQELVNKEKYSQPILPLVEIAAKTVAYHIPFEIVENVRPPVPEQLHLRITYWSFPDSEDEIRLYSCLANGSPNEYDRAENIIKNYGVKNLLQIGFYISATVRDSINHSINSYEVSLTFDRRRIIKCTCTCSSSSLMCCHIVAVCLSRILNAKQTELRAPVSESLLKLKKVQLRKFAQHLISELPQQILPTAQHILDDLLNKDSLINTQFGAPDPTSGPSALEKTNWCLDLIPLYEGIRKTLVKLKIVTPEISSDVDGLNQNQPHLSAEFTSFLRPLRGKEPEGMWNLISIIKHLMKKGDENSVILLKTLTEEIVDCDYVICWWFTTKTKLRNANNNNFLTIQNNMNTGNNKTHIQNFTAQSMQASSYMCDEIVHLWRLTVLNPKLSSKEKEEFHELIKGWHIRTMQTIFEQYRDDDTIIHDLDKHPGFKSALKACLMNWDDYPIPFITNCDLNNLKLNDDENQPCCSKNLEDNQEEDQKSDDKLTFHKKNESKSSSLKSIETTKEKRSIDDELNYLYKYEIKLNNDLNFKYPHVNQQQQFTYTLSTKKDDPIEVMFARAETLYAHGQDRYAIDLVVYLANCILEKPPKIDTELIQPFQHQQNGTNTVNYNNFCNNTNNMGNTGIPANSTLNKTNSNALTNISSTTTTLNIINKESKIKKTRSRQNLINANLLASEIYTKITFLCNVLINNNIRLDLAFRIGILGLELARPPAIIKALEVKLFYQEQELIQLLKKIPLDKAEMDILRERGRQIRDEKFTRASLLPLTLASLIFDALVLSKTEPQKSNLTVKHRLPIDDYIGFECAVTAIGLKCPFVEKDHQFLWESIRRQRFDFIINVLTYYKNRESRLVRILEKLLDKDNNVHFCDLDKKFNQSFIKGKLNQKLPNNSVNHGENVNNNSTNSSTPFNKIQSNNHQVLSIENELIEYEKKYSKCNCTLKDLNGKLISASSTNYSYTYNSLTQLNKNRFNNNNNKDKNKQIQCSLRSVYHINLQFMIDLAKAVITKAGGNMNENFDGNNIRPLIKPHKNLHYCAFLIFLYALGLNNQLTKWLQRTFSTLVTYVQKEAGEIGAPAINCLITTWKGYLTPSEAIVIACPTSASSETAVLKAKARLALSILTESQALRLIEIQGAIQLCKDQSEDMLVQALFSIQNSYKNGGLSSDILFETAKHWYQLYLDNSSKESTNKSNNNSKRKSIQQNQCPTMYPPFANLDCVNLNGYPANNQMNRIHSQFMMSQANHMISTPPSHFNYPIYYPNFPPFYGPPQNTNLQHQLPPNFNNYTLSLNNYNLMIPPPPPQMFKNHFQTISNFQQSIPNHAFTKQQQQQQQAQNYAIFTQQRFMNGRNLFVNSANKQAQQPLLPLLSHPTNPPLNSYQASIQQTIHQQQQAKSESYLFNAYSLGIMALDALPRKGSDERSAAAKFDSLNPQYYEEIIWLAKISFKLTPIQHQEFLSHVVRSVSSPFILYEIVMTIEEILATTLCPNHPSKNIFKPLISTTQHAFDQCLRYKLGHLSPSEYEDYAKIVIKAKQIFMRSVQGIELFHRKLDTIKTMCKEKDKEKLLEIINKMLKNSDSIVEPSLNHHHSSICTQPHSST